ncbi:MAG: serine/threonine-protein kinase [Verrucomicrobiia bacterium]
MDEPRKIPENINCRQCGALINLTGRLAFNHVECPRCKAVSVVPVHYGHFLLLQALGLGGTGTVYKAVDLQLNRLVAIKILRKKIASNPAFIEDFAHEARAAAAASVHPNVAQVYAFGEYDDQYYLAMELLERGSLDNRIAKSGKLSEREVLELGLQIAAGLRAAQAHGSLHRDIKPGNILFNAEGVPKIVDFGLSQVRARVNNQNGQPEAIWGTLYYIAPEKLRGEQEDFRSDIYSLGATLFHALTGRPPIDARTANLAIAKRIAQPSYPVRSHVPTVHESTARVVDRMLANNPAERFESYDALIQAFHEALAALDARETAGTGPTLVGKRILAGAILIAIVSLVIVIAIAVTNRAKVLRKGLTTPSAPAGKPQ